MTHRSHQPSSTSPRRWRRLARAAAVGLGAPWLASVALAGPKGLVEIEGGVEMEQVGDHTELVTDSDFTRAGFEGGFSIESHESVFVEQPSATSEFFAEDWSGNTTSIEGTLGSNGIVGLINPFGVFIGDEAVVDVAGLVAAAAALDETSLRDGQLEFGRLTGEVRVAAGARIFADDSVLLVGRSVANYGHVTVPGGTVVLAAGDSVTLAKASGRVIVRGDGLENDLGDYALRQDGRIDAPGGYVSLTAGDGYSLAMNHDGITRALTIELEGGSEGLVAVNGTLDASDASPGATGGSVTLTGELLEVNGELDASGDAGGGSIRVGGDVRGQGELATARRTYVGEDAVLRADALDEGDGGTVVVYARERAGFFGQTSARGGARGGDGGFAEISGAALEFAGRVDLGAERGHHGTLLFDPVDIEIQGSGDPNADPSESLDSRNRVLFGDTGGSEPFVLNESVLEQAVDADIVLEATNSIVAAGQLSYYSDGSVTLQPDVGLTMRTRNDQGDQGSSTRDPGIDLDGVDGEDLTALEWRTTSIADDGEIDPTDIELETGSGGDSVGADLSFGRLVADGGTVTLIVDDGRITGSSIETFGAFDDDPSVDIDVESGDATGVAVDLGTVVAGQRTDDEDDPANSGSIDIDVLESGDVIATRLETVGGPEDLETGENEGVVIEVEAGDVMIAEIVTTGADGEDPSDTPTDPGTGDLLRATYRAQDGGSVEIRTGNGNVDIARIEARGGNAEAVDADERIAPEDDPAARANGRGGDGGIVIVLAGGDGDVTAQDTGKVTTGEVDVSGGVGSVARIDTDGALDVDGADLLSGRGGDGGEVEISGSGTVMVTGPVTSNGGDSVATSVIDDQGVTQLLESNTDSLDAEFIAIAGEGGAIFIDGGSADDPGTPEVEPDNPVQVLGDVTASGGTGRGELLVRDPDDSSERIELGVAGGAGGNISIAGIGLIEVGQGGAAVTLQASGGDSLLGNAGSAAGDLEDAIVIGRADTAADTQGNVSIVGQLEANGGDGENGGAAGDITLRNLEDGGQVSHVGALVANGGASQGSGAVVELDPGSAEFGLEDRAGAGGTITVEATDLVQVGSASALGGDSAQGLGGAGGVISLSSVVGKVESSGLLDVGGGDGTTFALVQNPDPEDDEILFEVGVNEVVSGGDGGSITVTATAPAGGESAELLGGVAGAAGTGGNGADDGQAGTLEVTAAGDVTVDQIGNIGIAQVTQRGRDADTQLMTASGGMLDVSGADSQAPALVQTVNQFQTTDGDAALSYVLAVPADEALSETDDPEIDVEFARSMGTLGSVGTSDEVHQIANGNGDIVGVTGLAAGESHVALSGTLRLEADNIGSTGTATRLVVDGPGGELQLVAGDDFDGQGGSVFVQAIDASGGLAGIAVDQREAAATTDIELLSGAVTRQILIRPDGDDVRVEQLDTSSYGASFAFALTDTRVTDVEPPVADLVVSSGAALGGDLLLDTLGEISLEAGAIAANDNAVGLVANGSVGAVPGASTAVTIDDPSGLLAVALPGEAKGASEVALLVTSDDDLQVNGGAEADFSVLVQGATTGDLIVTKVEPDIGEALEVDGGIQAGGDVVLRTGGTSDIVLGESQAEAPVEVTSGGSQTYGSQRLLVDNVRRTQRNEETNDASLTAGGEVLIEGSVDTSPTAIGDDGSTFVFGDLEITARGVTTFSGDVGTVDPLARLDVTNVDLATPSASDTRRFVVGQGAFGSIDGAGSAVFETDAAAVAASGEDRTLTFRGDVGGRGRLQGFQADAQVITFTDASRVRTDTGGILLNTNEDLAGVIPTKATIGDRTGNLRLNTRGEVLVGDLHKVSAVGNLRITSPTRVRVGDVNANKIVINAPLIEMQLRPPGLIDVDEGLDDDGNLVVSQVPDGPDPAEQSGGVEWVANQINTNTPIVQVASATPALDGPAYLVLGTDGLRVPGGLRDFQTTTTSGEVVSTIIRLDGNRSGVTSDRLVASDGTTLLDLTGTGEAVVGDTSEEIPRRHDPVVPAVDARTDGAEPSPAPTATAPEVLALIRCEAGVCAPGDEAFLGAIEAATRGPLATPRAHEIARVYRERVAGRDGRVRLRATFAVAGRAYRDQGARLIDGASFYGFLAASDLFLDARAEIDNLAGLLVQVDLLGLDPADTRTVQRTLAESFASAAALPGFDVEEVLAAVDTSPIGPLE